MARPIGLVMPPTATVDVETDAFAKRLANLLTDRRAHSGRRPRDLAAASAGRFSVRQLKAIESAELPMTEPLAREVAQLYGVDLTEILPERLPLVIRPAGVVCTGGVAATFTPDDPESLLLSYLRLVRRLRDAEGAPSISLRREDVERLAEYLHEPGETVVERLASLMGATQVQRRAMVGLFVAGAVVIGLVGTAAAAVVNEPSPPGGGRVATDSSAVTGVTGSVRDGSAPTAVLTVRTDPATGRSVVTTAAGSPPSVPTPHADAGTDAGTDGAASTTATTGSPRTPTATGPAAPGPGPAASGPGATGSVATDGPSVGDVVDPAVSPPVTTTATTVDAAAQHAADRDAAVAAAARAAADAEAARVAAEQAAATAKADRIAAERAAAQAATSTSTSTSTSVP